MSRLNLSSSPTKHCPLISSSSKSVIKKKYSIISNDLRQNFIDRINSNNVTIKEVWLIKLIILIFCFFYRQLMSLVCGFQQPNQFCISFEKKDVLEKKKLEISEKPMKNAIHLQKRNRNSKTWFFPNLAHLPKIQVRLFFMF